MFQQTDHFALRARAPLYLFLALLAVYLLTGTYDEHQTTDTRATAIAAWNLAERGTLYLPGGLQDVPWERETRDGRTAIARFPGTLIWATPIYVLWPTPAGSLESAEQVPFAPAGVAAALSSALGVAALFGALRLAVSPRPAAFVALAIGLGSTVWSVAADALWTHGPSIAGVSLALYALASQRHLLATLGAAVAVASRPSIAVAFLILGLWTIGDRRKVGMAVWVGTGLGCAAVIAVTLALFDQWLPTAGYEVEGAPFALPADLGSRVLGALASPTRGLLITSPWLIVLAGGISTGWRECDPWVRGAAVGGIVYGLVQLAVYPYWGGQGYFGGRFLIESLIFWSPLLAVIYERRIERDLAWMRLFIGASVLALIVNLAGTTVLDPPRGQEPWQHFRERFL